MPTPTEQLSLIRGISGGSPSERARLTAERARARRKVIRTSVKTLDTGIESLPPVPDIIAPEKGQAITEAQHVPDVIAPEKWQEPKITTPEKKTSTLRDQKQQVAEQLGLKSGDQLINVAESFAKQAPDVVTQIGEYYYRVPISAKEAKSPRYKNLSSIERYKLKTAELQQEKQHQVELSTLEKFKGAEGYDVIGAQKAGVSTETLNKVFGAKNMSDFWSEMRKARPEVYEKLIAAHVPTAEITSRGQAESLKDFEKNHIRLPDGNWIAIVDWNELPEKYQTIGLHQGFDAMDKAMESDRQIAMFGDKAGAIEVSKDILKDTIKELDIIATSKGSPTDKMALDNAIRRAGFKMPSGSGSVKWRNFTDAEKRKVAEHYYKGQSFIGDILKEAMTFSQVKTATFNEKDIAKQYAQEREIAGAIYQGNSDKIISLYNDGAFGNVKSPSTHDSYQEALTYAKEAKGMKNKGETEEAFVNRAVGSEKEYATKVILSQPTVGELAKEFIPFREFSSSNIKNVIKSKDVGKWFDFATAAIFDIAMVIPVAGWLAKGASVGLKAATIGAKIASLGGMVGARVLRMEARQIIEKVAGEIIEKRLAVKLAEKALAKEIVAKGADVGLRREALQFIKADLKVAEVEHAARLATAKESYKVLDELVKAAEKSPLRTDIEIRAYNATVKTTELAAIATNPAWYTYGTMELGRTLARWDELTPTERAVSLAMAGMSYGLVGKTAGALKSAWETTTKIGRIPRRVIEVPEIYLPRSAGMPKTSVRGMTPKEQMEAMATSSKALEDLWQGKGMASYPWGKKGLKYEPRSEFQKAVPQSMIGSTPAGEVFKSPIYTVVTLREPAQYFSAWGFPAFTVASATGKVGKEPTYLVLFGEKIGKYPSLVGFANSPKEMQEIVQKMLYEQTIKKQAYPGFKLYRAAKEPEWIIPAGTEVGAGRSQFLGRIYGGVPLWTRHSPFGKKIELQPHFILDEAGARRTGFTIQEALALKAAGFEAELKHWIEKAQFWRRGITKEPIISLKSNRAIREEIEAEIPQMKSYRISMDKEIAKARQAGDEVLAKRLTKMRNANLSWLEEQAKKLEIAHALEADIAKGRTPQARELVRDLRTMESLRPALYRIVAARVLERMRNEVRTSRELRQVRELPVELRPYRVERVPERLERLDIARVPRVPRTPRVVRTPELLRLREPRPEEPRVSPERITPERIPPERIPPERIPPERVPPGKVPPVKPPLPEIKEVRPESKDYTGAVAWAQGRLLKNGKLETGYQIWKYPYRQQDLEWKFESELPPEVKVVKGVSSAYETIQQIRGKVTPRETQEADIGAFKVRVIRPTAKPGGKGEIEFTREQITMLRGMASEGEGKLSLHTTLEQLIEMAIKGKVPDTSLMQGIGMPISVQSASLTAKEKFAKAKLAEKMGKTPHIEIVRTINKMELTSGEKNELLKMLPDREKQQVRLLLSEPELLAPTRGYPKAVYLSSKLRRKKPKTKRKIASELMLVGVRL